MAITETRPPNESLAAEAEPVRFIGLPEHEQSGLAGFIGTGDHTSLGRAYILLSLLFGVLAFGDETFFAADSTRSHPWGVQHLFQVYTSSRVALVFLFAVPLMLGLATYLVPLQIGANTVAFPRAAAMAFWGWLIGSLLVVAAYAVDGGPVGGRAKAVDLSYAGLALVLAALVVAAVCVLTTVIALRPPGMWLDRVPMFSWSMVVAGTVWVLTLPVLLANILLIYVDHHYGRPSLFGVGFNQWPQLSWAFMQPQIYVIAIPALGIANDVIATFTRVRQQHRSALMATIGAFGILSFGAYAQPAFYSDVYNEALFIAMSVLIIVPALVLLGGWMATLRAGRPLLDSPLLFVLGAALVAVVATIAGGVFTIRAFKLHDSGWARLAAVPPFVDGHFLLVVTVVVLAGLGGVVYWSPKVFGRKANEGLAKLAALVGVVGGLVAGLPLLVYGFALKSSGLAKSAHFLYGTSALGSLLLLVALVLVLVAVLMGRRQADDDAWGVGQTLEWTVASPPSPGQFGQLETVVSAEPVLDRTDEQEAP